jgi:hypothetical protein
MSAISSARQASGHTTGQDWFGVWWHDDPITPGLLAPDVSKPHVLEDIEDWEDVIVWPDLEAIDWDAAAKADLPNGKDPNRILMVMVVSGPFERLHDLLGFENALVATIVSPEACGAFFTKLCDFKIEVIRKLKKYYDVDLIHFQDDWGTQKDLFFRPDFWREYIKPNIKRVIDATHEEGMLFDMHSCGRIDLIVDEIIELGPDVLDPRSRSTTLCAGSTTSRIRSSSWVVSMRKMSSTTPIAHTRRSSKRSTTRSISLPPMVT